MAAPSLGEVEKDIHHLYALEKNEVVHSAHKNAQIFLKRWRCYVEAKLSKEELTAFHALFNTF